MSVLNDKQIIKLSTLPTYMVRRRLEREIRTANDMDWCLREVEEPSHETEGEILKDVYDDSHSPSYEDISQPGYISHRELTEQEKHATRLMISPFSPVQVRTEKVVKQPEFPTRRHMLYNDLFLDNPEEERKIISWGTSSFGYDFRVDRKFKIFTNINSCVIDPLNFDQGSFVDYEGDFCLVPPNSFVLCNTMEYFKMPKNVVGIVTGKSTIARSGLSIMATPLEPGWEGYLTLEYANTTPLPVKLYAGMGGGQIVFFQGEEPLTTYDQRKGKYQGQAAEPVTPRV